MAAPSIKEEKVQQIVALRKAGHTIREIAAEVGVSDSTATKYAKQYHHGGIKGEAPPDKLNVIQDRMDVDGSIQITKMDRPLSCEELMKLTGVDKTRWIPQYYKPNIWEGFYKTPIPHGEGYTHKKVQLFQSKAVFKRIMTEGLEQAILKFTKEHITALDRGELPPRRKKKKCAKGEPFALAWGMWDAHLGMYAWNSETGNDFDLNIATTRVLNSIDQMVDELKGYNIAEIWMPVGNDFMHFDSVRMTTAFGEHFLDVDSRYAKVYLAALRCLAYMVERAMEICDNIKVMYVPGNHDVTSSFTLCAALSERFRNDVRVDVDLKMNPRKYKQFGGSLVMFDHGVNIKPNTYPLLFASECHEQWSSSTYREVQIGHKHQKWEKMYEGVVPTNGVLLRMNPTLCNVDAWHHSKGFIGGVKSVEAWRYDKLGYRGSHVTMVNDQDHPIAESNF